MILPPSAENIKHMAESLKRGACIAFPTETVYGLGADACQAQAVARIYELKKRPHFNPLIVHIKDLAMAEQYGVFSPLARKLARAFWPGALSLIVPRHTHKCEPPIDALVSAGLPSLALRVPAHPVAQDLLHIAARPIAAPSANRSGRLSPTRAEHIAASWPEMDVLDGGAAQIGLESTIISCLTDEPILLRRGGIARGEIEKVAGCAVPDLPDHKHGDMAEQTAKLAPGRLAAHYAPRARLRLNAETNEDGEALLAFGAPPETHHGLMLNLSASGNLTEAAGHFFSALHELDAQTDRIAVMPIPDEGLGEAINDRLRRAVQAHQSAKDKK